MFERHELKKNVTNGSYYNLCIPCATERNRSYHQKKKKEREELNRLFGGSFY